MKKHLLFILILVFAACSDKVSKTEIFEDIINQNFISIVGTHAYAYRTFFPYPGQEILPFPTQDSGLVILFEENVLNDSLYNLKKSIAKILRKDKSKQEFTDLLTKKNTSLNIKTIDLNKITNRGKYILQRAEDPVPGNKIIVGSISFFTPYIDNETAMFMVSRSHTQKAGRINLVLFKKMGEKWTIFEQRELIVW